MAKNGEITKKLNFQKVFISTLSILFIIFMILSFITKELWAITCSMVSIFVLVDYLFIITVFNGKASKNMKK